MFVMTTATIGDDVAAHVMWITPILARKMETSTYE